MGREVIVRKAKTPPSSRPQNSSPATRGFPWPRPGQCSRRAPPAPRGKMAPAEQLRHQPWRRARPSAILAPSSRPPPPRHPHPEVLRSGRLRAAPENRAVSAHTSTAAASPIFGPARASARGRQAGPRVLGAAREPVRVGPRGCSARCSGTKQRLPGRGAPPAGARRRPSTLPHSRDRLRRVGGSRDEK